MKRPISKYILLPAISLFLVCGSLFSQEKKMVQETKPELPVYRGLTVGADIFGIGNRLFGGDALSSEISLDVNLKHRFFPVVEAGYAKMDAYNEDKAIGYKTSAPYFRIGMDYNTMAKKNSPSYLYVGLRYGFSSFSYDVDAPDLKDPIWGTPSPFVYNGVKANFSWMEVVVGVKVQIYKRFLMGWSLRYKARFGSESTLYTTPSYVPGYGNNKSTIFGITYNLIYKLPF